VQKVWAIADACPEADDGPADSGDALELRRLAHRTVRDVTDGIEKFHFNVGIARMNELANALRKAESQAGPGMATARREGIRLLAQISAPFAPHLAEECWARIGGEGMVATARWPSADPDLMVSDTMLMPIQVNGKKRGEMSLPRNASHEVVEEAARSDAAVAPFLSGLTIKKVIVVPGRIVNIVAS
jgi:leucyl-tRNA synthetase